MSASEATVTIQFDTRYFPYSLYHWDNKKLLETLQKIPGIIAVDWHECPIETWEQEQDGWEP